MGDNAKVGAYVFSSPPWPAPEGMEWPDIWYLCTGWTHNPWTKEVLNWPNKSVDKAAACGVDEIHFLEGNKPPVVGNLTSSEKPGGCTFTHSALTKAEEEMKHGRSDAKSIIILITDGEPTYRWKTWMAAEAVKNK